MSMYVQRAFRSFLNEINYIYRSPVWYSYLLHYEMPDHARTEGLIFSEGTRENTYLWRQAASQGKAAVSA